MSLDWNWFFEATRLEVGTCVLRTAGCSAATVGALAGTELELSTLPARLSSEYRAQVAAAGRVAVLGGGRVGCPELVQVAALQQALRATPLGAVAADLNSAQLARAEQLAAAAQARAAQGHIAEATTLGTAAHEALVGATVEAYDRLRAATNLVARDDLLGALGDLGFEAEVASDAAGNHGVWARRGDEHLAAVVSGAGSVELDLQGYEGTSCVGLQTALAEALRARGWEPRLFDAVLHQRRTGGALIVAAARLAREQGSAPPEALLCAATSTAPATDGRERLRRALLSRQGVRQRVR